MGEHNNYGRRQETHTIIKATVWMPDGPHEFVAPNILAMGCIPGTQIPFIDVAVVGSETGEIERLTGFAHSRVIMGPPPKVEVAKTIPRIIS